MNLVEGEWKASAWILNFSTWTIGFFKENLHFPLYVYNVEHQFLNLVLQSCLLVEKKQKQKESHSSRLLIIKNWSLTILKELVPSICWSVVYLQKLCTCLNMTCWVIRWNLLSMNLILEGCLWQNYFTHSNQCKD